MNIKSIALVCFFSCLLVSPIASHPLGLDSKLIGNLAVPLISIGGSIITGKLIADTLEGRHPFGHNTLIHTDVHHGHHGHHDLGHHGGHLGLSLGHLGQLGHLSLGHGSLLSGLVH